MTTKQKWDELGRWVSVVPRIFTILQRMMRYRDDVDPVKFLGWCFTKVSKPCFEDKISNLVKQFLLEMCPLSLPINRSITIEKVFGRGWSVWHGLPGGDGFSGTPDQDSRSAQIMEIDPNRIVTYTGIVGDETVITGEVRLKRMRAQTEIISFDFWTLWTWYAEENQKTLRWLYDNGKIGGLLEELGTILRSPSGGRFSLFLFRKVDGCWGWGYYWLVSDRDASHPAVGLAS